MFFKTLKELAAYKEAFSQFKEKYNSLILMDKHEFIKNFNEHIENCCKNNEPITLTESNEVALLHCKTHHITTDLDNFLFKAKKERGLVSKQVQIALDILYNLARGK